MKRVIAVVCGLILLAGGTAAEAKGTGFWEDILRDRGVRQGAGEKELWRKELGEERSLLLYIDENGRREMRFTDGPWVYLTEELVGAVKEAGVRLWERENGLSK